MTNGSDVVSRADLDAQIKLLVRTEQRLSRARRSLDLQLDRMNLLSDFALACSGLSSQDEIWRQGLAVLQQPYFPARASAFRFDPAADSIELLERENEEVTQYHYDDPGMRAMLAWLDELMAPTLLHEVEGEAARLLELAGTPSPAAWMVVMPIRLQGTLAGVAVLRDHARARSHLVDKPGERDAAFFSLVSSHIGHALENANMAAHLLSQRRALSQRNLQLAQSLSRLERTQQALSQAQKMEAIGRLAGGVAHDFNNMLTVIISYATLMSDEADCPMAREIAESILEAGDRAADLTRQLLAFSRTQPREVGVVDVNVVVGALQQMLSRVIEEDTELHVSLSRQDLFIQADRSQLEQIVLNLVVNAHDAISGPGSIRVRTRQATADELLDLDSDRYCVLEVKDTGSGMDEHTQRRLFEPFFTTKDVGKGTGMGLATVYGIVKASGGEITVDSKPGHGSTFRVFLPTVDEAPMQACQGKPDAAGTGSESILLVEDDAGIRRLVERVLHKAGYRVTIASNGREALELGGRERFDLLVTDIVMPYVNGVQLATELGETNRDLRVLYMSGYAGQHLRARGLKADERFLAKPFTPAELLRNVRSALEGRARPSLSSSRSQIAR